MPTLKYPPGAIQRVMGGLHAGEQHIALCVMRPPLLDHETRTSRTERP
jgi:hypothetical protein